MKARDGIAIGAAVVIAGACSALGFWQLSRLRERRVYNASVESALHSAPVQLAMLTANPRRLSRVVFTGEPDYQHEVVVTGRTRQGSPGVNILTPFRLPGRDTAILVNRGWVYSPDAAQVDFEKWKESDTLTVSGFVDTLSTAQTGSNPSGRQFRQLHHRLISAQLPYPVATWYVIALEDGTSKGPDTPVRLPLPALDEGPHKSYAIQWFSFAAIALLGTAAYVRASRLPKS